MTAPLVINAAQVLALWREKQAAETRVRELEAFALKLADHLALAAEVLSIRAEKRERRKV